MKTRRIHIVIIIAGFILALLLTGSALAASSGTCGADGDNLIWTLDDQGTLTISGSGQMKDFDFSNVPWFDIRFYIKKVIISEGVTSIGDIAFSGCSQINSLTLPESIERIGNSSFSSCSQLTSITIPVNTISIGKQAFSFCSNVSNMFIPANVVSIGEYAFQSCTNLINIQVDQHNSSFTSKDGILYNKSGTKLIICPGGKTEVTIPDDVTSICDKAFVGCSKLTSIIVPDSITSIGEEAFADCNKLTSITLSNNLTSISDSMFLFCSSLENITIPNSVTRIGNNAFTLSGIKSITIPDSVTSIGDGAFSNTGIKSLMITASVNNLSDFVFSGLSELESISVDSNNPYFTTEDGVLYNKNKTVLVVCPRNKTAIIMPDTVKAIATCAFEECTGLKTIEFPDGLESIGVNAFSGCSGLTNIVFPSGLTSLGGNAFSNCHGITNVIIPNGIDCYSGFFSGCDSLESITLPDTITRIDDYAFYGCSSLKSVNIPNGVTYIGNYAFQSCSNLTNIEIPDTVTYVGEYAFSQCSGLTNIDLSDSITSIGHNTFYYCSNLKSISIPTGVTSIGNQAFLSCSSLTSVTISDTVVTLGNEAFNGCTSLSSITLSDKISKIGRFTFYNCNSLTRVILPDKIEEIGESAFSGCSNLEYIALPERLNYLGSCAFYCCEKLTDIELPENLEYIANGAFYMCKGLERIVIPKKTKRIEGYAFYGCTNLKSATILGDITEIDDLTFYCCTQLESIQLPDTVTTIGKQAFYYCNSLNNLPLPDHITNIDETAFENSYPRMYARLGSDTAVSLSKIGRGFYTERDKQYSLMYVFSDNEITGLELYSVDWYSDETIYITDDVTCVAEDIVNAVANHWINGKSVYADLDSVAAQTLSKAGIAFKPLECNYKLRYLFTEETITGLELVEADDDVINILVPSGVTSIADNAFLWCGNLKIITIPATVNSIGENAFRNCWRLEKVVFLTKDVEQEVVFGNQAFYYYSSMQFYCYRYTDPAIWCVQNQMPVIYLDDVGIDSIRTVEIQQEDFRMACGDTAELTVNMFPADGTEIVWTSSTPEVVGVEDGIVTALTEGTATITASVGQVSDSIVINTYIAATGFRLSETEMWIIVDDGSIQLDTVDFEPEGASTTITWASSDTRYATVDNTGLVMPYKPGEVLITATTEKGISKQCLLHMCYPVSGVSLIAPQNALLMGDDMQLTANVTMNTQSCINHLVSFTSSDESIATVDSETGLLHAIAPGRVTITAASKNDKSSSISIKVNFDLEGRQILHLPADLQEIGAEAFSGLACEAVIIPDSCTTIGERAFAGCDQLLYVYIPTSVTNISADAFDGCDNAVFEYEHE